MNARKLTFNPRVPFPVLCMHIETSGVLDMYNVYINLVVVIIVTM